MNVKEFDERTKLNMTQLAGLQEGDGVLVGVSGGADSVALLISMSNVAREAGVSLRAVHVEHGIRGDESLGDQQFVVDLCQRLGVDLTCKSAGQMIEEADDRHASLEERARNARYRLIEDEAAAWNETLETGQVYIALAHHGNDNAETIIFNMVRGTGIDGLRGIPVRRDKIIRPLLGVTREDIEAYLRDLGQPYCTDSTNRDTDYDRNRIRIKVIPELQQINARAVEHMNSTAGLIGQMAEYINCQAAEILNRAEPGESEICVDEILRQPDFLQREILHQWIGCYIPHAKDVSAKHLQAVQDLMTNQVGRRASLPQGFTVVRTYAGLKIFSDQEEAPAEDQVTVVREQLENNNAIELDWGKYRLKMSILKGEKNLEIPRLTYTKYLNYDKMIKGISIRKRGAGDYFQINSSGGTKSFSDYCINEKIPEDERDGIPLICDGNHIMWAVGYRISEYYKVEENTRLILKIEVTEENKVNE